MFVNEGCRRYQETATRGMGIVQITTCLNREYKPDETIPATYPNLCDNPRTSHHTAARHIAILPSSFLQPQRTLVWCLPTSTTTTHCSRNNQYTARQQQCRHPRIRFHPLHHRQAMPHRHSRHTNIIHCPPPRGVTRADRAWYGSERGADRSRCTSLYRRAGAAVIGRA